MVKIRNLPLVGIAAVVFTGAAVWKMNPVERRVVEIKEIKKVEKIEKIVIPKPSNIKYEPLKKPDDACHGAPVVIEKLQINGAQGDEELKNPPKYTWLTVRPAGDAYKVLCYIGGDYSEHWEVGDLVSIAGGKVTGKE